MRSGPPPRGATPPAAGRASGVARRRCRLTPASRAARRPVGARARAGRRAGAGAPRRLAGGRRRRLLPNTNLNCAAQGALPLLTAAADRGRARAKPQGSEEARFVLSPCAWCCTPPPLPESGWNRSCGPWRGSAAYTHRRHSHRKLDAMQATGSRLATSQRVLPLCGRASRWRPKPTGRARRG